MLETAKPNIVLLLQYVQNDSRIKGNSVLNRKYAERRKFYSCTSKFNYVSYTHTGSLEKVDYIQYSGDFEKSSGVFGANGLMDEGEIAELKDELRNTDSVIWHGVLSFEEKFGKAYMTGYEDAYRLMKTELPRFLKDAGLDPKNITWYAGLHENTNHAHIHFSFFENEPSRYSAKDSKNLHFSDGNISKRYMRNFKIRAEQRLTDMTAEIHKARQGTADLLRDVLFTKECKCKYNGAIGEMLLELKDKLPKEGRFSYDSENMIPLRPLVNRIVDTVIKSDRLLYKRFNRFCAEVNKKDADTVRILKANGVPESEWQDFLRTDKYLTDLYRRLDNHVISAARYFSKLSLPYKKQSIVKAMKKKARLGLLAQCAFMTINIEEEAFKAFREYLRKLEENERELDGGREEEQQLEME